jgi:hypothetical protein
VNACADRHSGQSHGTRAAEYSYGLASAKPYEGFTAHTVEVDSRYSGGAAFEIADIVQARVRNPRRKTQPLITPAFADRRSAPRQLVSTRGSVFAFATPGEKEVSCAIWLRARDHAMDAASIRVDLSIPKTRSRQTRDLTRKLILLVGPRARVIARVSKCAKFD